MDNIEDSGVTGGALLPTLLLGKSGDSDVGAKANLYESITADAQDKCRHFYYY